MKEVWNISLHKNKREQHQRNKQNIVILFFKTYVNLKVLFLFSRKLVKFSKTLILLIIENCYSILLYDIQNVARGEVTVSFATLAVAPTIPRVNVPRVWAHLPAVNVRLDLVPPTEIV